MSSRKEHDDIEQGYYYLESGIKPVDNAVPREVLSYGDISQHQRTSLSFRCFRSRSRA